MIVCVGLTPALQRTLTFSAPVVLGEVNRAERTLTTASGKATNVARVLTTLGQAAILIHPLGGGTGRSVAAMLEAQKVPQEIVPAGDNAPTRICTTLLSPGVVTELVEEAGPLAPTDLERITTAVEKHLGTARALCLSGSLPMGVPDHFHASLVRLAHAKNVPTVVDLQGLPLKLALAEKPQLAKPNRKEAARALGLPETTDAATLTGMLQQAGAAHALVSDGKEGAWLAGADGALWKLSAPPIEVLNPIGSGDSLTAGLLAGLIAGLALPEAARLGMACAGANCLTPTSGVVDPSAVAALRPRIEITPLRLAG